MPKNLYKKPNLNYLSPLNQQFSMKSIFSTLAILVTITFGISQDLWINEFDYDNPSTDDAEFIELAGIKDLDISSYTILLVNGGSNTVYAEYPLSGTLTTNGEFGFHVLNLPTNGFQNGGPDGLALVLDDTNVVEFISYEGTMTDVQIFPLRPDLYTSTDVGVDETNQEGSIQLIGTAVMAPFTWVLADPSPDTLSQNQNPMLAQTKELWISEIDYDNIGSDDNEFVEISGELGLDLTEYSLYFVNGNNDMVYEQIPLTGTLTADGASNTITYYFPPNTVQNGSPDGIALVKNDAEVIEFLSYEGVFNDILLISGSSDLYSSTDIEVSDNNSDDISAQLINNVWTTGPPTPTNVYSGVISSISESSEDQKMTIIKGDIHLTEVSDVNIYDINGRVTEYSKVDLISGLNPGLYIVHVVTANNLEKVKVFIR